MGSHPCLLWTAKFNNIVLFVVQWSGSSDKWESTVLLIRISVVTPLQPIHIHTFTCAQTRACTHTHTHNFPTRFYQLLIMWTDICLLWFEMSSYTFVIHGGRIFFRRGQRGHFALTEIGLPLLARTNNVSSELKLYIKVYFCPHKIYFCFAIVPPLSCKARKITAWRCTWCCLCLIRSDLTQDLQIDCVTLNKETAQDSHGHG